ncbi:hypothetical protein V8F63_14650 [Brevundimonas sp. LF-1]|uniref:hypothetical protein n=1 Tax=Brevundimonas sp. LF-1 TaxID=3126100 RepID=UPI0030E25A8F
MPQKLVTLVLTVTLVCALETPGRASRAAAAVAAAVIIKVRIFASGNGLLNEIPDCRFRCLDLRPIATISPFKPPPEANIPKVDTHLGLVNFN